MGGETQARILILERTGPGVCPDLPSVSRGPFTPLPNRAAIFRCLAESCSPQSQGSFSSHEDEGLATTRMETDVVVVTAWQCVGDRPGIVSGAR